MGRLGALVGALVGTFVAATTLAPCALNAQADAVIAPRARPAAPSRADSLLARGRLAAAEQELYANADAKPRDPAARGALAAYLASRGRFAIALVLFDEAQRFGADAARVNLARAAIRPYTLHGGGPEVTLSWRPSRTPGLLGSIELRARRSGEALRADIDANVVGVVAGVGAASRLGLRRGQELEALWLGDRRVGPLRARVDSTLGVDELRLGLDAIWNAAPLFDERGGTLTLGRAAPAPSEAARSAAVQLPWLLTFPGLQLVPRVGEPPMRIESAAGRALLRGKRWQIDPRSATIVVDR